MQCFFRLHTLLHGLRTLVALAIALNEIETVLSPLECKYLSNIHVWKFNDHSEITFLFHDLSEWNIKRQASILSELGGGGKRKQCNKSDQLILWPKLEAIPSQCQMLEKKGKI